MPCRDIVHKRLLNLISTALFEEGSKQCRRFLLSDAAQHIGLVMAGRLTEHPGPMMPKAKGERIRASARFSNQARLKRRTRRRHARGFAGRGRTVRSENHLDLRIAGDGSCGTGQSTPKKVDALNHERLSRPSRLRSREGRCRRPAGNIRRSTVARPHRTY